MWIITLLVVGQCPAGSSHYLFVAKPGKTLNFVFGFLKCASSAVADLGEGPGLTTPPPLNQGLDGRPPPPYLEVWIRHCSVQVILTLDSTFSGYQPWRPGHMGVLFRSCQQLYQALPLQQQFLQAHPLLPDQVILTVLQQKHFISISLVPYSSCILMGIYTQHLTK